MANLINNIGATDLTIIIAEGLDVPEGYFDGCTNIKEIIYAGN